jgi:hypothetical protein
VIKKCEENMIVDVRQIMNMAPSLKNWSAIKRTVRPSYFVSEFISQLKK